MKYALQLTGPDLDKPLFHGVPCRKVLKTVDRLGRTDLQFPYDTQRSAKGSAQAFNSRHHADGLRASMVPVKHIGQGFFAEVLK